MQGQKNFIEHHFTYICRILAPL